MEVLSFTEQDNPHHNAFNGTSACAVKPFPRHRARLTPFHGLQRHIPLLGVCLLRPPGTPVLNRNCLLPSSVPGGRHCPCTWHAHHEWKRPKAITRSRWKALSLHPQRSPQYRPPATPRLESEPSRKPRLWPWSGLLHRTQEADPDGTASPVS